MFQRRFAQENVNVSSGRMNEQTFEITKFYFQRGFVEKGQRGIKGEDGQAEGSFVWERNTSQ